MEICLLCGGTLSDRKDRRMDLWHPFAKGSKSVPLERCFGLPKGYDDSLRSTSLHGIRQGLIMGGVAREESLSVLLTVIRRGRE